MCDLHQSQFYAVQANCSATLTVLQHPRHAVNTCTLLNIPQPPPPPNPTYKLFYGYITCAAEHRALILHVHRPRGLILFYKLCRTHSTPSTWQVSRSIVMSPHVYHHCIEHTFMLNGLLSTLHAASLGCTNKCGGNSTVSHPEHGCHYFSFTTVIPYMQFSSACTILPKNCQAGP